MSDRLSSVTCKINQRKVITSRHSMPFIGTRFKLPREAQCHTQRSSNRQTSRHGYSSASLPSVAGPCLCSIIDLQPQTNLGTLMVRESCLQGLISRQRVPMECQSFAANYIVEVVDLGLSAVALTHLVRLIYFACPLLTAVIPSLLYTL